MAQEVPIDPVSSALVQGVLSGDRRKLARLLTQVENDTPEGRVALAELFHRSGQAHLVGVTGAPGSGKSSLVCQLARHYRHPPEGEIPRRVAVVAVDPSSPFSGGAVLGDRVRMRDLAGDAGVFIRSMASRGALGGLSHAAADVVQVLDAAGYDVILIETVGAGQSEVEIASLAHTTLVVEAPGMGDDVQTLKAGLLEIADILVVNKADHPGVQETERSLRSMLNSYLESQPGENQPLGPASPKWLPPVLCTTATSGVGIQELVQAIDQHAEYLRRSGEWQSRETRRLKADLESRLRDALFARWREKVGEGVLQHALEDITNRRVSPQDAVKVLVGF
jgi:LAO/AO transport system kinase